VPEILSLGVPAWTGRTAQHLECHCLPLHYAVPNEIQLSGSLNAHRRFFTGILLRTLSAFRRETQLAEDYRPRTLLQLAEYMAFSERYGKRRIPLPGRRSQQLIILRAHTFSQQQPPELSVDLEQATESSSSEGDQTWNPASNQRVREQIMTHSSEPAEDVLRRRVIRELVQYLRHRGQADCAHYFALRLLDRPTSDIEAVLELTPRQRDYLQQRFKYHLTRFALSHHWELVHQWLEADLDRNLGLTPHQWRSFRADLDQAQIRLLQLKQAGLEDAEILRILGCTPTQLQKQWSKLLEQAWDMRNCVVSGSGISTNE
jgi:hypothetical protein